MDNMTIEEILAVLESEDTRFDSNNFETVPIPFPISSQEYLSFAKEDLKDSPPRGPVNALSNAKRALDARIDSVLIAFGLLKAAKAKQWNVPKKLSQIEKLGVVTPHVLTKLNSTRNLIEHEFHKPTLEQVEDFVDVVSLFHEATRIYLHSVPNDAQIMDDATGKWISLNLDYDSGKIILNEGAFSLQHGDNFFDRVLNAYAKLLRNWYDEY